jgi:hypothetical protein
VAIPAYETPASAWRPLAIYQPSKLIGDSRYCTVLHTADSLGDVTAFYASELHRRGWLTTSHVTGRTSVMLVARHGAHSATISINHTGTGTAVAIASY